jgi:hypothetical protein
MDVVFYHVCFCYVALRMWNVVVYVDGGVAQSFNFSSPLHTFFIDKQYFFIGKQ